MRVVYMIIQCVNVSWFFTSGTGLWPHADPWGVEFSPTYMPQWHAHAGSLLASGWKGVFDGIQADQDWLHKVFKLKRTLNIIFGCLLFVPPLNIKYIIRFPRFVDPKQYHENPTPRIMACFSKVCLPLL